MAKGNKYKVVCLSKLISLQVTVKFEGDGKKVYSEGNFYDKLFSQDFTPAIISASFSCEVLQRGLTGLA